MERARRLGPAAWSRSRIGPRLAKHRRAKTVTLVGDGPQNLYTGPLPKESLRREMRGLRSTRLPARQRPSAGVPASHARTHLSTSSRLKLIDVLDSPGQGLRSCTPGLRYIVKWGPAPNQPKKRDRNQSRAPCIARRQKRDSGGSGKSSNKDELSEKLSQTQATGPSC